MALQDRERTPMVTGGRLRARVKPKLSKAQPEITLAAVAGESTVDYAARATVHNNKASRMHRLPNELLTLIAQFVGEPGSGLLNQNKYDFSVYPIKKDSPMTKVEAACYSCKLFYAIFRPHLYHKIHLDACDYHGKRMSTLDLLEKLHAHLQREPKIAPWIKDFNIELTDDFMSLRTTMRNRKDWLDWARNDSDKAADVFSQLTRVYRFHIWLGNSRSVPWSACSQKMQSSLLHVFGLKTLVDVDLKGVLLPPPIIFLAPNMKDLDIHFLSTGRVQWWQQYAKFNPVPDGDGTVNRVLPQLENFKLDDAAGEFTAHVFELYPTIFSRLRELDLKALLPKIHVVQSFLDHTGDTLESFSCSVNGFRPFNTQNFQYTPFNFTTLTRLQRLELSWHADLDVHTPAFEESIVHSFRSLTSCTRLRRLEISIAWSCWRFHHHVQLLQAANGLWTGAPGVPNVPPLPDLPDFKGFLHRLDSTLKFICNRRQYPQFEELFLYVACSCCRSECQVRECLDEIDAKSDEVFKNLKGKGKFKLWIRIREPMGESEDDEPLTGGFTPNTSEGGNVASGSN